MEKKQIMNPELIQKIGCVFEACGSVTLSEGAMKMVVEDLEEYPENEVSDALDKCRMDVKGRLSLAHIIERLPTKPNTRPVADEAYSLLPWDESQSAVWTEEMAEAFGICSHMHDGDETGCRLAFRAAYERLCGEYESAGRDVKWSFTPGTNKAGRERVLKEAVDCGRMTDEHARRIMPQLGVKEEPMPAIKQLMPSEPGLTRALLKPADLPWNKKGPDYPRDENGNQILDDRRGTIDDIPADIDALYEKKNIRPYLRAVANYLDASHVLEWLPDLFGVPPEEEK